jgi:exosortase A
MLWLMGNVADVQLVQHIALIGMLDSLVWTFLGTAVVRIFYFPLLFVFFAVPVGESLVAPLQRWTAAFTVAALRVSGIPAFQDGLALYTPSGSWQVAEACSGIRYLIASMVIGVLVAGVAYRSWSRRIAFLTFSALLPIAANAIRAYGIVALAYFFGNSIAVGADHVIYGFVFFSIITVTLLVVGIRGYEPLENEAAASNTLTPSKSVGAAGLIISLSSVILLLVAARGLADYLWSRTPPSAMVISYPAPAGWAPTMEFDREWAPEPFKVQGRKIQSFAMGTKTVSTAVVWYSNVRRGVELINSTNAVGKSGVWIILSSDTRQVNIEGNSTVVVEHAVAHGRLRRLVWMWYSIDGQRVCDPYRLRAIQTRDRFLGRPRNVAFVAVSAPYNSRPAEASEVLQEFLK